MQPPQPLQDEMYLIFHHYAHSVVYFVRGCSVTDAIGNHLREEREKYVILHPDGSVDDMDQSYPHVIAHVEANYKIIDEWQIRYLPEWAWTGRITEAFVGEHADEVQDVVSRCRSVFLQTHPRSRAEAFVWYLNQGTLVTFYRKIKPYQIEVLGRYLWDWNGKTETIEEWHGNYQAIADNLSLKTYQLVP